MAAVTPSYSVDVALAVQRLRRQEGPGRDAEDARHVARADHREAERAVEGGGGRHRDRPVPEVGVRAGLGDDQERRVGHVAAVGQGHREAAVGVVVGAQPRVERGDDEQWVRGVPLERRPALDRLHDRGVEADPAVEQEVAVADAAQPDALERASLERVEQGAGRLDRVVGDAERAGVDVGGAAGEGRDRGVGADQAVGRLVERAVAGEHHHDVDALGRGAAREACRVAAAGRLGHLEVVIRAQRLLDDHAAPGRHRRRGRVDDEQDPHDGAGYRPCPTTLSAY